MLVFSWFVYGIGVSVTCRQSDHLLNVILGMEFMALGVYCVASVVPAMNMLPIFMLLMTFSVGEVAIMLSLLVVMARAHGNDRCSSLMVDKC
uniref:NADH-ubiquinone oxidoreductase chain 4L n=1 Tax=Lithophaga curta TaxID=2590090 RepID=A0A516EZI2_9BIVA|nr:NADH dehydrogenase subunit 4L [Lithophaga curta]